MGSISDNFVVTNRGAVNGATVDIYSRGAWTAFPPSGPGDAYAPPSGAAILATTQTGRDAGNDGAFLIEGMVAGDYVSHILHAGEHFYKSHTVSTSSGSIYTLATDYPNLQAAINATPAGGTLFIPVGTYTISGATYNWTHEVYGTKTGLVVKNKKINILGAGRGTILQAGAANVDVLSLYSTANNASNRTSFITVANFKIQNAGSFPGCNGLVFDRAYRNRVRDLSIVDAGASGFVAGIFIRNSWIVNIEDVYIYNCTTGVDATQQYSPDSGENGASHAVTISGAEIATCNRGVWLRGQSMVSIHDTTIEGHSIAGVEISGAFNTSIKGCYFEQVEPAYDLIVNGNSRNVHADNMLRVKIRDSWSIHLSNFRDIPGYALDLDDTAQQVWITNPWTGNSTTTLTQSITGFWNMFERGLGGYYVPGEPKSHIFPTDDVGINLLANGEMGANGAGWTFTNMSVQTSGAPFGLQNCAYTTNATPAAACLAYKVMDPTFDNILRGQLATISYWIKVPDPSWTAKLELRDGDRAKNLIIDDSRLDNNWHRVSARFRIGDAATTLAARCNFTVGTTGGVAYCAGASLTIGSIPTRPEIAGYLSPMRQTLPPVSIRSTVTLGTSGQLNPFEAARQLLVSDGGAVTITSGQAFFTDVMDGYTITLYGTSNTNTLTLPNGASPSSTKLRLGAASRTLVNFSVLTLTYSSFFGAWVEDYFRA